MLITNHIERIQADMLEEGVKLRKDLVRSVKVLTALEYGISAQLSSYSDIGIQHQSEISNGLCRLWPLNNRVTDTADIVFAPAVELDYMFLGAESMCRKGSVLHSQATQKLALAPMLSFLHDLDNVIAAVHFISADGYVITSPEKVARRMEQHLVLGATQLPFWKETAANRGSLSVTGPAYRSSIGEEVLSLSSPVIKGGKLRGEVIVDISVNQLVNITDEAQSSYRLINTYTTPLPADAYFVQDIQIKGVDFTHTLFYQFDTWQDAIRFVIKERVNLLIVLALYVFAVTGLFYLKSLIERRYFKDLAERDPMTGVFNRRGLEMHIRQPSKYKYIALGVYDIDDFKKINDNYGHDKGDEVLCFVANKIGDSIRDSDAVARFGGEEFVVYLLGDNKEGMTRVLKRVREVVEECASEILDSGFTISGGISITLADDKVGFETQFKDADAKLYVAKTSGKNQVIV
ncbi:diguanylate cyclase [Vibrio sp. JC009]|uniref:sensor domain-containing diguanylate cyclase n=1 Tax=Vibrio sp. JC009 TaxID=2912314 RepID=UPI0023AF7160|nr:sensor domain-containing diguanylate cyclase [Vibrio sp. JC009]WED22642.1 diguanylate cyclase [Vibrio sp. JC009]